MPRKKLKSPSKKSVSPKSGRRIFPQEFKEEAVQMLLDGHTASSVAKRLGLSGTNILYRWKGEQLAQSGMANDREDISDVYTIPFPGCRSMRLSDGIENTGRRAHAACRRRVRKSF